MKGKKVSHIERKAKVEQDSIERKKVFKELLAHIEAGYSLDSFPCLSANSVRGYFERYPDEFVREEYEASLRKGRVFWEDIGKRQANGQCLGNSRTWFYNMANRFGWREKIEVEAEHKGSLNVNVVSYATRKASQDSDNTH